MRGLASHKEDRLLRAVAPDADSLSFHGKNVQDGAGIVCTLVHLYWWQRDGVYYVIRHAASGERLDQVGRFHDLDAAIALGMSVRRQGA